MFIGYFPQEWILFLSIGAICAAFLGVIFGIRCDIKSFKGFAILLAVILSLLVSSIAFDFHYFHEFADNGETHPKPLYGCSDLQRYLETVPAFRNPSPSTWKDLIEQSECRSGAIATILVSSILAWSSVFLLFAFFCLVLRFGLNRVCISTTQDLSAPNIPIATPSTAICQEISSEYFIASLDGDKEAEKLIECIFHNICIGDNEQPDGWDGHIFREFIIQDFKRDQLQKKTFKEGFKVKGNEAGKKVNITWTSFLALKNRAPSEETAKEILEWKAMCAKTSPRTLLGKFVMYYEENGKNPEFFKDVISIAEKLKSELK
jgi:hypothetical protein